jgi:peroxiredoxin
VSVDVVWDTDTGARDFVARHKLPFPVGRDTGDQNSSGAIGNSYAMQATPLTYFIDRNGIVVVRKEGEMSSGEWEKQIEGLLAR